MKGLLIKDIRLLLSQKKLLLMIALLILLLAHNGLEFILGYFIVDIINNIESKIENLEKINKNFTEINFYLCPDGKSF